MQSQHSRPLKLFITRRCKQAEPQRSPTRRNNEISQFSPAPAIDVALCGARARARRPGGSPMRFPPHGTDQSRGNLKFIRARVQRAPGLTGNYRGAGFEPRARVIAAKVYAPCRANKEARRRRNNNGIAPAGVLDATCRRGGKEKKHERKKRGRWVVLPAGHVSAAG